MENLLLQVGVICLKRLTEEVVNIQENICGAGTLSKYKKKRITFAVSKAKIR